jgi:hypothetical protein
MNAVKMTTENYKGQVDERSVVADVMERRASSPFT